MEYPAGSIVTLDVTPNRPGDIHRVELSVFDEEGAALLSDAVQDISVQDGAFPVWIDKAFNVLPAGVVVGARRALIAILYADGQREDVNLSFLLRAPVSLVVCSNSFLTAEMALVMADAVPNLRGWKGATEANRSAALQEAFTRICRLSMRIVPRDPDTREEKECESTYIYHDLWDLLTVEKFNAFPVHFKRAIRRAQLLEAEQILRGEVLLSKRRAGVISETIGESSVTLSPNQANMSLSDEAISALEGYLFYDNRIVRA